MGAAWLDGGERIKTLRLLHWHLIHILRKKYSLIDDTTLSENFVFRREGWDAFTSAHSSLRVMAVISSHKVTEKVYLFQGPPSITHLYTNKYKKKFFIDIPLVNPSVNFKKNDKQVDSVL